MASAPNNNTAVQIPMIKGPIKAMTAEAFVNACVANTIDENDFSFVHIVKAMPHETWKRPGMLFENTDEDRAKFSGWVKKAVNGRNASIHALVERCDLQIIWRMSPRHMDAVEVTLNLKTLSNLPIPFQ